MSHQTSRRRRTAVTQENSTRAPQPSSPVETSEDLLAPLIGHKSSSLWLGRFSETEILRSLEECGFLKGLRALRLQPVVLTIAALEPFLQALKLFHMQPDAQHLLAEFRLQEKPLAPKIRREDGLGEPLPRVLAIEWLVLQNTAATFAPERPILPGQRFPGLGLARCVLQWLIALAQELQVEGLTNHPEYFHNAYLYRDRFHFYDPRKEGLVQALTRDLLRDSLAQTAWGLEFGCACDENGQVFSWESDLLILPLSQRLEKYFRTEEYLARVEQASASVHFRWNEEKLKSVRAA
jgi:hypothetical protein